MDEQIEKLAGQLVQAVLDADLGIVRAINISVQASHEHPFTVVVEDVIHPPVGLARTSKPRQETR